MLKEKEEGGWGKNRPGGTPCEKIFCVISEKTGGEKGARGEKGGSTASEERVKSRRKRTGEDEGR